MIEGSWSREPDPDPYLWLMDPVQKQTDSPDSDPQHCFYDSLSKQLCHYVREEVKLI